MNPGNPTSAGLWTKFKQFWKNAKNEYLEWEKQQLNEPSASSLETQDRNSTTKKSDIQFIPPPNHPSRKRKRQYAGEKSPKKTVASGRTPKQKTLRTDEVQSELSSPNKPVHLDLNNDASFDAPFLTPINDLSPSRSRFHSHRQPLPSSSFRASESSIRSRIPSRSSPSPFHFHDPPTQTDPPFPTSSPKTAADTNSDSLVLFQRLESIESMLHNLQDKLSHYERNASTSPFLFGPPNGASSPSLPNFPVHSTPLQSKSSQRENSNAQVDHQNLLSNRTGISGSVEETHQIKENGKELYELSESSTESEDSLILEEFSESRAFNSPRATQDKYLQTMDAKKGNGNKASYNTSSSLTLGNRTEPANQNVFNTSTPISNRTALSADEPKEIKIETPDFSNNKDNILANGNKEVVYHENHKEKDVGSGYTNSKGASSDHISTNDKSMPVTGTSSGRPDISTTMFEQLTPIPKTTWSHYSDKQESSNPSIEHSVRRPSRNSQNQSPRREEESTRNDIEHTKEALARLRAKMQERLKRHNAEKRNQS
ncbi:hypothetical protein SPOG_01246 [Schizosaccharomyces cryophilus OY26]|uniref:Uncharacterized protein n=1 Tax=Schizosaccharomyces cryophilus (strain OY26 / ATCC MYA-4695 / CBS 11777 / NBRC 106824 / NRRL Y48691) TaxID=653667 RepID=S9VW77_SCHCR|nr:uncharacterized protein SPOG_01246 [Schizosaccharomyces cryophilus OY26]EPY50489.1 hypothetical protein SPOG_01246 [Schizosaccharomyces cryophilus OY26]